MCVCPEGYRKVGFGDECEDVNECEGKTTLEYQIQSWPYYVGRSKRSEKSTISRPLWDLGSCPLGHLLPLVMGLIDQSPIA